MQKGALFCLILLLIPTVYSAGCYDIDGGPNFFVKGETGFIVAGMSGLNDSSTDTCHDKILTEYYCAGGKIKSIDYTCPDNCVAGECTSEMKAPTPSGQPSAPPPSETTTQEPETPPPETKTPPPPKAPDAKFTDEELYYIAKVASTVFDEVKYLQEKRLLVYTRLKGTLAERILSYEKKNEENFEIFLLQIQIENPTLYEKIAPILNSTTINATQVENFTNEEQIIVNKSQHILEIEEEFYDPNIKYTTEQGLVLLVLLIVLLCFLYMIFKKKILRFLRLDLSMPEEKD